MDMVWFMVGIAFIGFVAWALVTQIPKPAIFNTVIYIVAGVCLFLLLIAKFGKYVPNVMP